MSFANAKEHFFRATDRNTPGSATGLAECPNPSDKNTISVQALHEADSHSWWKRTKQFFSVSDTGPLQHLDVPTGQSLADDINTYFVSVSNDLTAIDPNLLELVTDTQLRAEFVIEPYQVAHKLSRLNIYLSLIHISEPTRPY